MPRLAVRLVSDFLSGAPVAPMTYLDAVARDGHRYNGFNLVVGDFTRRELAWYGNRADAPPSLLDPGIHGLSNSLLDTPWPKLVAQRDALRDLLHVDERPSLDSLIETMRNPQLADDHLLPSTGLSLERERVLSAAFIESEGYGTRSTTALRVVAVDGDLTLQIKELSDDDGSHQHQTPRHVRTKRCVHDRAGGLGALRSDAKLCARKVLGAGFYLSATFMYRRNASAASACAFATSGTKPPILKNSCVMPS